MRSCEYPAAVEQYLERFGSHDAGTKLASHHGRWTSMFPEADGGRINQVFRMQAIWRKANQKTECFFFVRSITPLKILLEGHFSRHEIE